jgi:AraC-like DNA-binding protein
MFYVQQFSPHPLLRGAVDAYLMMSVPCMEKNCIENTILPHVFQSLVLELDDYNTVYDCSNREYTAPNFIVGPNDRICRIQLMPGMKKMVVNLKPGGLFRLFEVPAYYFNNRSYDATNFLGNAITELSHRLREAPPSRQIELMDSFLLKQLQHHKKSSRSIDEAIGLIYQWKGNLSLKQLEQSMFISKRTLERHFFEQTGLHPKIFSRVVRLNEVIKFIECNPMVKWPQLADLFGYYDQCHFINEFKSLVGCLPHDYFSLRTDFEKVLNV